MMQPFQKAIKGLSEEFSKKSLCFFLMALFVFAGCGKQDKKNTGLKKTQIDTKVTCEVSGLSESVTGNTLRNVTYNWTNLDSLENRHELMVKVHFLNSDGKVLFQDDHNLPKSKDVVSYTRELLVPLIPRKQTVVLKTGLFLPKSDKKFLISNKSGAKSNKVEVATFVISPPLRIDDLPEARLTFSDGWYEKEYGKSPTDSWRWIGPESKCFLKGADRDLVFYLRGWIPSKNIENPLNLTMSLNGEELGKYSALAEEFIIKRVIPDELIKDGKTGELTIRVDGSFKPAESGDAADSRELSIMVKEIYFN